ncbi:ABC transporter permease subunit, partial [Ureaplasma urealyticum]
MSILNLNSQQTKKIIFNKKIKDKLAKTLVISFAWLFSICFIGLVVFIIIRSIPGFEAYGLKNIFWSKNFNLADYAAGSSVWFPLAITLLVSFGAIIIAAPIGIKTATFIKFRIKNKRLQKFFRVTILALAGIPSVIFGLFAIQSLGPAISFVFHIDTVQNITTSMFMLAFIIIPTIISLTLSTYDGIDMRLIENGIGMGSSYTRSIYKIFKKEARGGIIIAIIIALGRAIGETMAISMILSDQGYQNIFGTGFLQIMHSALRPLGAVISANMFAENGGEGLRGLLYIYGIVLFVVIMILNGLVTYLTRKRSKKTYAWFIKLEKSLAYIVC